MKHLILALVLVFFNKLGLGLVLGDPIIYIFGIRIEIKSNQMKVYTTNNSIIMLKTCNLYMKKCCYKILF